MKRARKAAEVFDREIVGADLEGVMLAFDARDLLFACLNAMFSLFGGDLGGEEAWGGR